MICFSVHYIRVKLVNESMCKARKRCRTEMWSQTVEQFLFRFQLRFCIGGAKTRLIYVTATYLRQITDGCILLLSW